MVDSTLLNNSSNFIDFASIASWASKVILTPISKGNMPFLFNFQQLLIVIGITYAEGANLVSIFKPFSDHS